MPARRARAARRRGAGGGRGGCSGRCLARRAGGRRLRARSFPGITAMLAQHGLDAGRGPATGRAGPALRDGRNSDRPRRPQQPAGALGSGRGAPAPASTAPTGWRPTRCSRAWCSPTGRPVRSLRKGRRFRWPRHPVPGEGATDTAPTPVCEAIRAEMRDLMTADVGLQRSEASLLRAEQGLADLTRRAPRRRLAHREPAAGRHA